MSDYSDDSDGYDDVAVDYDNYGDVAVPADDGMEQDVTPADDKDMELDFPTNDLKIDLYDYKNEGARVLSMEAFDRAVLKHETQGVNSLNIRWFTQYNLLDDESLRINSWLESAVKGGVNAMELNFMLPQDKPYALPSFVQSCTSLSSLSIDMHRRILKLPSLGFVWLQTLILKDLQVDGSLEEVISMSKGLQSLILEEVSGIEKLKIISDSLIEVRIIKTRIDDLISIHIKGEMLQTLNLAWYFSSPKKKHFELFSSKLKALNWRGDTVKSCSVVASPEEASFNFRPPTVEIDMKTKSCLAGLLQGVGQVKKLEINCWHIEILTKDIQLGMLNNLADLVINVWDFNEEHQIPAIASFLELVPKLQNLWYKNCRQPWGDRIGELMGLEKSMYANRGIKNMLSQLKRVEMELTGGNKELELANYLTKHSMNLESMKILYSLLETHRLDQINSTIKKFEKASSHVVTLSLPYV